MTPHRSFTTLLLMASILILGFSSLATANKTITLQGSGDSGSTETISLAADAQVSVTVNEEGIVVTLPVNVRVKCYGDETEEGYCLLAVSDGTGSNSGELTALTPSFGTPSSRSDGFTVQITNYDSLFTWSLSTTAGTPSISSSGLVTVGELSAGGTATLTVTTTRSGYATGTASTTGSATSSPGNQPALTPTFASPSSTNNGFTVQITNYNGAYEWTPSTNRGSASISSSGLVTVSSLSPSESATVTVTTTRSGYNSGSASVTGQAGSGTGNTSEYCSGNQGAQCSRSFHLDDMYGVSKNLTITIPARGIIAIPFTLNPVDAADKVAFYFRSLTDEAVLSGDELIRAFVSEKPGGDPISSLCDGYGTLMRGTFTAVQYPTNQACSLPTAGGVFYMNYGITCRLGDQGCASTSDLYNYGFSYKFFLERDNNL